MPDGRTVECRDAALDCQHYKNFRMLDSKTGLMALTARFRGSCSQDFDLREFPFDTQRLQIVRSTMPSVPVGPRIQHSHSLCVRVCMWGRNCAVVIRAVWRDSYTTRRAETRDSRSGSLTGLWETCVPVRSGTGFPSSLPS